MELQKNHKYYNTLQCERTVFTVAEIDRESDIAFILYVEEGELIEDSVVVLEKMLRKGDLNEVTL
jgi:hypothetical protein